MKIGKFLARLLPLRKRESASLTLIQVNKDAFLRRAFQLWATDRHSDEAQEVFRALENSRAPTRCRATLSRVK